MQEIKDFFFCIKKQTSILQKSVLSSLKADPGLYFKTLGVSSEQKATHRASLKSFFVFCVCVFFLKASDILSWLTGETPQCRKHLRKSQNDKDKIREQGPLLVAYWHVQDRKDCSAVVTCLVV